MEQAPPSRRRRLRRRAVAWLAVLLAYVGVMTFGGCADRLVLFPSTHPINAGAAARKTIDFNGRELEIWTARSRAADGQEPEGFVLEFCGNATRAEEIADYVADRWASRPVEAWVVNYPGYGGSAGGAKLNLIPPAALAAYDALAMVASGRPIFVEGNSLGTAPALYVAAHRPVAGLVLQNPPPLQSLILRRHGWYNLWLVAGPVAMQVPAELNSLKTAPKVTVPAIFLTADGDTLVPPAYQRRVVNAYAGSKRIIDLRNASHWDGVSGDAEKQLLEGIEWLWQGSAAEGQR
jgi:alpha-beta hydrolase superfamily lysophospholipase